jgi:dipeptidase D
MGPLTCFKRSGAQGCIGLRPAIYFLCAITLGCLSCKQQGEQHRAAGTAVSFRAAGPQAQTAEPADSPADARRGVEKALQRLPQCESLARFRAFALEEAEEDDRIALLQWTPPKQVTRAQRSAVQKVMRRYLTLCGTPEVVQLTCELLRFETVADGTAAADSPSLQAMRRFVQAFAQRADLQMQTYAAGSVWELSLGHGPHNLALVSHADVAPVGPGWTQAPFKPQVVQGRLYGRGSEANKGPLAASLVVLRTLSQMGLVPPGRVSLLIGTGAEQDWSGMQSFVKKEPAARQTLVLDGVFPLSHAEQGTVHWALAAPMAVRKKSTQTFIEDVEAGLSGLQVPGMAKLRLRVGASADAGAAKPGRRGEVIQNPAAQRRVLIKTLRTACASEQLMRDSRAKASDSPLAVCDLDAEGATRTVTLKVFGATASTAYAEQGDNALSRLARICQRLDLAPNGAASLLQAIHKTMAQDDRGRPLGLAVTQLVPTQFNVLGGQAHLEVTLHRPGALSRAAFAGQLDAALQGLQRSVDARITCPWAPSIGDATVPQAHDHLVESLVSLFEGAWEQQQQQQHATAAQLKPQTLVESTYAQLFAGAVTFGPRLPGATVQARRADEFIEVSTLSLLLQVYSGALLQLE